MPRDPSAAPRGPLERRAPHGPASPRGPSRRVLLPPRSRLCRAPGSPARPHGAALGAGTTPARLPGRRGRGSGRVGEGRQRLGAGSAPRVRPGRGRPGASPASGWRQSRQAGPGPAEPTGPLEAGSEALGPWDAAAGEDPGSGPTVVTAVTSPATPPRPAQRRLGTRGRSVFAPGAGISAWGGEGESCRVPQGGRASQRHATPHVGGSTERPAAER